MNISSLGKVMFFLAVLALQLRDRVSGQHVNDSMYAIVPYHSEDHQFPSGAMAASLSVAEIDIAEQLLKECIHKHNIGQQKIFEAAQRRNPDVRRCDFIIDLSAYKRQYVCAVNGKKEKVVWINCFCYAPGSIKWKQAIVEMKDGGNCFLI